MGERKGQNHYYPPDFNYKKHKTLNSYHGVHALRERGAKAHLGILTIRFEMPFNVWCLGCNNHVGMGVRYNAEKKKVGMYYTTPLYEFRMKCHLCDNYFVIRTDPKNFDYEMVEGLRRQEKRFDPSTVDNLAPVDRTFNHKLAADAMFKAEHEQKDKVKLETTGEQIDKLEWIQSRMYDDYGANQSLRKLFRTEKTILNERRAADGDLKKRLSLGIALQPETKEDKLMAARMLKYKDVKAFEERHKEKVNEVLSRPILPADAETPSTSAEPKPAKVILQEELKKRTAPGFDHSAPQLSGRELKRRRESLGIVNGGMNAHNKKQSLTTSMGSLVHEAGSSKHPLQNNEVPVGRTPLPLVDYESDSDE